MSLVNTRTPKTRRAAIAILAPAKPAFPVWFAILSGLWYKGVDFPPSSPYTLFLLLPAIERSPTVMTSVVPLPALTVAPEIMNRVSADFEMGSGSPVRALSSHLPSWPPKRMPSTEMVASMCALKETMSPTHMS